LKNITFRLLKDFYKLLQQKEKTAEAFIEVAHKHGNHKLADMIVHIANMQEPIKDTVAIINELKQNGYVNHIGSNIGSTVFKDLQRRKPHIFNNQLFELDKSQIASYKDDSILKKPNKAFFEQYLNKNNLDPKKTKIIFVDDIGKNVYMAQDVGMIGIHFKNAQQLRRDLIAQGISLYGQQSNN